MVTRCLTAGLYVGPGLASGPGPGLKRLVTAASDSDSGNPSLATPPPPLASAPGAMPFVRARPRLSQTTAHHPSQSSAHHPSQPGIDIPFIRARPRLSVATDPGPGGRPSPYPSNTGGTNSPRPAFSNNTRASPMASPVPSGGKNNNNNNNNSNVSNSNSKSNSNAAAGTSRLNMFTSFFRSSNNTTTTTNNNNNNGSGSNNTANNKILTMQKSTSNGASPPPSNAPLFDIFDVHPSVVNAPPTAITTNRLTGGAPRRHSRAQSNASDRPSQIRGGAPSQTGAPRRNSHGMSRVPSSQSNMDRPSQIPSQISSQMPRRPSTSSTTHQQQAHWEMGSTKSRHSHRSTSTRASASSTTGQGLGWPLSVMLPLPLQHSTRHTRSPSLSTLTGRSLTLSKVYIESYRIVY